MNLILLQTTISTRPTVPNMGTTPLAPDPCNTHLHETMPAYIVARKYLLTILIEEICANMTPEVFNKYESTECIINAFHRQFASYTYQEPPFLYANKVEPLTYWKGLLTVQEASVLAVHAAQKADTIVNITKVKQHLHQRKTKVHISSHTI